MGGLKAKMPVTFWTFLIGTLAIAGIPPLAGYFSKDAILAGALADHRNVLFAIGLGTALLTAFYMSRLLFLTFFGRYRGDAETESHIHESPWSMLGPLVILALGSAVVGFVHVPDFVQPVFRIAAGHHPHPAWLPFVATGAAVIGIAAAFYLFVLYREAGTRLAASLRGPARLFEAKYGFDLLYDGIAERGFVRGGEKVLWRGVDATLIDGLVNGAGTGVAAVSRTVRVAQSGLVRSYALLILGGALALFAYLLWA